MRRDRWWVRPLVGVVDPRRPRLARRRRRLRRRAAPHRRVVAPRRGAGIAAVTTVCGAWRWVLVARGLGMELPLRAAVAECYRSQFLNVTLPGGVIGDVSRGCGTAGPAVTSAEGCGPSSGSAPPARWCSVAITAGVVLLVPSPLSPSPPSVGSSLATVLLVVVAALDGGGAGRGRPVLAAATVGAALPVRVARTVWPTCAADCWDGIRGRACSAAPRPSSPVTRRRWCVAARAAGVRTAPVVQLLPLALVVFVAMGVPLKSTDVTNQ